MSKATFPVSTVLTKFTFAPTASGVYANASTKLLHANYDQSSPEEVVSIWIHLSSENKKIQTVVPLVTIFPSLLRHTR